MKNMIVLFGGPSVEHDVSVITAIQAMQNVDMQKYQIFPIYWSKSSAFHYLPSVLKDGKMPEPARIAKEAKVIFGHQTMHIEKRSVLSLGFENVHVDVALPIFHGTAGEDGSIQGLLEVLEIPYSGCNVAASAIGMDKVLFKSVMQQNSNPAFDCQLIPKSAYPEIGKISFPYPVIVKPVHLGSSIGVKKAVSDVEVKDALEIIFELDTHAMIEPFLENMMEVNCSVLGNSDSCTSSVCEQPMGADEVLSFADKYLRGGKNKSGMKSGGMDSLSRRIPAPIDQNLEMQIKTYAQLIYKAVGCSGVVRIDFMIDKNTNNIYVTEINTIPGSLSYYLWEASGVSYADLIDKLVESAEYEYNKKHSLMRTYESELLN